MYNHLMRNVPGIVVSGSKGVSLGHLFSSRKGVEGLLQEWWNYNKWNIFLTVVQGSLKVA
ncbi:hypothetical protein CQ056_12245 [Peribacillus simplex]|nr:hypothetical protein CQ056_12245 [Peribacillus simplex]